MRKIGLTLFLLTLLLAVFGQKNTLFDAHYRLQFDTNFSSGDSIPFWMRSNQNGIFAQTNNHYQFLQAAASRGFESDSSKRWKISYGIHTVLGLGDSLRLQMNQYWFGVNHKGLVIEVGAKAPAERFGGLSSTNGNYIWSNNARPIPAITIATNNYIPVGFWEEWLTVKGLYQENFFFDDQFIKLMHLHHKLLSFRATLDKWKITAGLEHLVYWGGNSPEYGELPGWEDYPKYIFGLAGSANAPTNDAANVSGNSLGMYTLEAEHKFSNFTATFYWNHPFEDKSGMELNNIADGLWGIHLKRDKRALLAELVYEFMNTSNQSGPKHKEPHGRGKDDYFNNWVYKSGHTHYGQTVGSPLYMPNFSNSICIGFSSNRMIMHHLGLSGHIREGVDWKALVTWSNHFGTYNNPTPEPLGQFSFLAECRYQPARLPIALRAGLAGDQGELLQGTTGIYAGISYHY